MINIYRNKIFNSKFLSLFLCLIMFSVSIGLGNFSYAQLQYATSFSTSSKPLGSGSSDDPFQITNAEHIKQMQGSSDSFILLKNISISSHNPISNFSGTFDGNGFTITINKFDSSFKNMGLFGSASGATIKNVNVLYSVKVSISFSSDIGGDASVGCFGGICASATASSTKKCIIENCNNFSVNISFSSKGEAIGGIVGTATGSTEIKNCTNRSNLTMTTTGRATYYGGIVGFSTNKISYCSNYGDISGTATYAGGIVGRLSADLTYCYNLSSSLSITNKTNTTCYIGGIVGYTDKRIYCSTNDAEVYVKTNTNIAYVGGIAGQSNNLNLLSNNGDVTLETQGYEFYLGGISGSDSYTGNTSQLISRGYVKFESDQFDYERGNVSLLLNIGGVIGQSSSKSFNDVYCDVKLFLPLVNNEYKIAYEQKIFGNIGLIVGNSSQTSVTCADCYYMGMLGTYIGSYPTTKLVVHSNSNDLSLTSSMMIGEEYIVVNLEYKFKLNPFGNISPTNKQGTDGLKIYSKSESLYKLQFEAVQNIEAQVFTHCKVNNSGKIFYEFYQDKIQTYQSGDDVQKKTMRYSTNNGITYFPMYNEDGCELLYFWQKLNGFEDWPYSTEVIDNQTYFLRGGQAYFLNIDKARYESYHTYIYTRDLNKEKMSNPWWDPFYSLEYGFDYIGPLSIVRNGDKCTFNLNLIGYGAESFLDYYSTTLYHYTYEDYKKQRIDFYGGKWVQDTYTFAEFNLDPYNTKQFASGKKLSIENLGGIFTSNFQSINNKYYAGASSSMFW